MQNSNQQSTMSKVKLGLIILGCVAGAAILWKTYKKLSDNSVEE